MTEYETTKYRGYTIKTYYDPNPQSPREWGNLGTMYTLHRNYQPEERFKDHFEFKEVFDQHQSFLSSFQHKYIAHKIYLYEHSGITVSTSPFFCKWDSGLFGIIAVPIEKVKKEYGWKKITAKRRKEIESYLQGEVNTYNDFITGEVYGFELISPTGEEVHSCWGIFGDSAHKHILSECKSYTDHHIQEEWIKKLKSGIQLFLPFPEWQLTIT